MFEKLLKSLKGEHLPVTPRQGKRLLSEPGPQGNPTFTIRGQGRPGFFFIFFGAMFGGIPSLIFFATLFGGIEDGDGEAAGVFVLLFLVPFMLIGATTFLTGLFLWFGRTTVAVGHSAVRVERSLFGKPFQRWELDRSKLAVSFEESHRSNDVPSYKLKLDDGEQKIGVGGSLKEEELLWLNRELRSSLGEDPEEVTSVVDSLTRGGIEFINNSEIETNYRSPKLQINPTVSGWEARTRTSLAGNIGLILFGSVFLIAGLMMWDPSRNWFFDLFPVIREALADVESSGSPPWWFALIFGGTGAFVVLLGIFFLGYRSTFALRHSRFFIHRRWLVFSRTRFIDIHEITGLETKENGQVNNEPRFRLTARLKDGSTTRIMSFAARDDVGQIQARLRAMMK